MRKFISFLSPNIEAFIAYREASECWNDNYERMLWYFDRYCSETYPDAKDLSQEMVDTWCKQHDTEINSSCISRIYGVVNFVKYLRSRGLTNINPPIVPRHQRSTFIPHFFTEQELQDFFDACDNPPVKRNKMSRSCKISIPVFFRLLYSSGIRTYEARMLRVEDVDLNNGILDIQQSKGYNQHFIVLHDSMLELMRRYDNEIRKVYPDRAYFFPASKDKCHANRWVERNFNALWDKANKPNATAYAFRHHYAISNINNWLDEGFGFDDKLLYLSKSMGHSDVRSTKYYYSLTPGLADILEEKTNADFENIVPEVAYEEIE